MPNTKQSNKQTQSVKVVVNNKISSNCCDDKKKKRKPKKKQQPQQEQQPLDEFPVLNTPANSHYPIAGIAPMAVRNQVYIPSAMQISPEGATQPIPAYFDRHYTNLTRTMEDFRNDMMNEIQDVKNLMYAEPYNEQPIETEQYINQQQPVATPIMTSSKQQNTIDEQSKLSSPVQNLINTFERNRFERIQNTKENNYKEEEDIPLEEDYIPQEEEPFVLKSPEQEGLFSKLDKLYDNWKNTSSPSKERNEALEKIREYATEFQIELRKRNKSGRLELKNASTLRADISKKIKTMI